jgi:predicted oxidoreductase
MSAMSDLAIDAPEVFEFLDALRESGKINMFGAAPHVQEWFGLTKQESRYLVGEWMRTFAERHAN